MAFRSSRLVAILLLALFPSAASAQTSTERVPMRDGVELATDVYLPAGTPPFPVLVYRTPYGRAGMQPVAEAIASRVPAAVVVQDVRGRFDSGGTGCVFRCELGEGLGDGVDTFGWIGAQTWSNGVIVSAGGSAVGIVQYMQAAASPPGLAGMFVEVGTPSFYDHALYQGGVFRQSMVETWLMSLGMTSAAFIDEVRAHPLDDGFWDPVQTETMFAEVNAPGLHVGGWFDIFAQGTIDAYVGYQHRGGPGARGEQKLVMGPWTHSTLYQDVPHGELTFPSDAVSPGGDPAYWIPWVLHRLGLAPAPTPAAMPNVQYYVMGDVDDPAAEGNEWRAADDWPIEAGPIRMYLHPGALLSEACPPAAGGGSTTYRYDPADPSPTVGGANLVIPAGPFDQRDVEARGDTVVFETPILDAPLELTGRVRAHFALTMDVVDTDVMVRLTDVYPDGRSMLILDGAARVAMRGGHDHLEPVAPGETVEVDVDLWSTSIVFAAGHRVRVSITGSNSPRFRPSLNDGTSYGESGTPTIATVNILHGTGGASYVELPQPARAGEAPLVCTSIVADGGVPDGGITPPTSAGCGCRAAAPATSAELLWPLVMLLVWSRRRAATV